MIQDDKGLLTRLRDNEVEFVVIGGVCGVIHGASLVTQDLDICCRLGTANLNRIAAALGGLHPFYRLTPNRIPFEITDDLRATWRNLYLQTDIGRLDCLGEVLGVGDFSAVLAQSEVFSMSYGAFRVLNLDALISAKEAAGREKDLIVARQLRAIREKRSRKT